MKDGIRSFQDTLPMMGPGGVGVTALRKAGLLSDLEPGLLDAIRAKCRLTFCGREFSLREAVGRGFEMTDFGSWDEAGGAATRDVMTFGLAVAVYVALTDRPEEFGIRTAPDGEVFFRMRA